MFAVVGRPLSVGDAAAAETISPIRAYFSSLPGGLIVCACPLLIMLYKIIVADIIFTLS